MKILHLIAGGVKGGAGRGAYTLHLELINIGVESVILTDTFDKDLNDTNVHVITRSKIQLIVKKFKTKFYNSILIFYTKRKKILFSTGFDGIDITKNALYKNADIIHLHWINGLVNISSLSKIRKPIVWTLRDLWPLTGGCHFGMTSTRYCDKFETGCGECVVLNSNNKKDLSYYILQNKIKNLPRNITIVGISNWISSCAKKSLIFKNYNIITISNNIDIKKFSPIDKSFARKTLNISNGERKVILYGGFDASLFHKGFDTFIDMLNKINLNDFLFVFFGKINTNVLPKDNFNYINFGVINNDFILSCIYSSADVYLAPSYLDSFGKTIAESMSCCTPVVCFDSTGPSDIIENNVSGYKAKPFSTDDFIYGLNWILSLNEKEYNNLADNCRARIINNFNSQIIAKKYLDLYITF